MYFRQGQLMCIEPQQGHVPLERRLLRAGVISLSDLQEVEFVMSTTYPVRAYRSEIQVGLALAELGLVSHEQLYAWMRQEAIEILKEPLTWSAGEVSFAEGVQPPVDRLPLALRITSLLPSRSASSSISSISDPEPVGEEPTLPLSAPSPLFKIQGLKIEGASISETPPAIPTTPLPVLFKRSNPSLPETPLPRVPLTPPPFVEEHLCPAIQLPQLFKSSAGLLSAVRATLPLPDYDLTVKLSTPKQRRSALLQWEVLLILAILLVAALAHGFNMFHFPYYEDDVGIMGLVTLSLYAFLGRGGEIISFYLVPPLPLLALNVGLALGFAVKGLRSLLAGLPGIMMARVVELVTVGLCVLSLFAAYTSPDLGFDRNAFILWNGLQADAQNQATQWIEKNLPRSSLMIIDESMWTDLYDHGYTSAHYYWKVQDDPAIRDKVFHDNWRTVDYVVTTI